MPPDLGKVGVFERLTRCRLSQLYQQISDKNLALDPTSRQQLDQRKWQAVG